MSNSKALNSGFLLYLIILLVAVYIAIIYIIMDPTSLPYMEAKINMDGLIFDIWKYFFYAHITFGLVSLALGPFLLINRNEKTEKLHRNFGIFYAATIFINTLIVPYLAIFATGGLPTGIAFLTLAVAWFATTWVGVWRMIQKEYQLHQEWMLRSYVLTMVFVTFRILVTIISMSFQVSNDVAFPVSISLAIVVNLVIVEILIRKSRRKLNNVKNVIS
ncbi:DUF2306 domain-containing protein [Bacillus sp. 1NLA3E]|uniref:DUF2306 domain-containing protein n=1 Tax=Bacillus sp. 1NLA3E TaxID=666686 RepID=UPI000247EAC8|nr:DUF2306 domain-containing protein [Bacillus sp. 1NLA3E]AGK53398.1 hypothetical protein B1NLA3E_08180 [Bacillus sp. 1NLA3E]